MMRLFLKATLGKRGIYVDSWVLAVSSFVFAFVLVFSSSMAVSLLKMQDFFQQPHITVRGAVSEETLGKIRNMKCVGSADRVARKFGVLENGDGFVTVAMCCVGESYFSRDRLEVLGEGEFSLSEKEIAVSESVAGRLNVSVGDRVAFVDSEKMKPYLFTVARIFSTGFGEFDDKVVFSGVVSGDSNLEITLRTEPGLEVFSSAGSDYGDISDLVDELVLAVEPSGIRFAPKDTQVLDSSLNSIRFVLVLFMLLSLFYTSSVVKNFETSNRHVFSVFGVLGARSLLLPEAAACSTVALGVSFAGLAVGAASALSVPSLLSALRRTVGISFDYYMVFRRVVVPYASMALYLLLIVSVTVAFVILRSVVSGGHFHGAERRD